jgi:hypothetical protein
VKHWTVTWYDTRPEGEAAEDRAIKGEHPRFNIAGAPEPVPVRFAVREITVVFACVAWMQVPVIAALVHAVVPWSWLGPVTLPFLLTAPVPLLTVVWVHAPGSLRRFGTWLERHLDTSPAPAPEAPAVALANRRVRRAEAAARRAPGRRPAGYARRRVTARASSAVRPSGPH